MKAVKNFKFTFTGRKIGSRGSVSFVQRTEQAETQEAAEKQLLEEFEHITDLKLKMVF